MDNIMGIVEWVKANWATIIQLYLAIIGLASVIVKITPTQADDEVLGKIIAFLSKYVALNKK